MKGRWKHFIVVLVLSASSVACEKAEQPGTRQPEQQDVGQSERQGTGQYFTKNECSVAANSKTHIYHLPGDRNYGQMLEENKDKKKDNRVCFQSKMEAEKAGYRRSRAGKTP